MTSRVVRITNPLGMHARAAARFVRVASAFTAHIKVAHNGRVIDGKSIMGLLLLAAARGSSVTLTADGPDEDAAMDALSVLITRGFGEESTCLS